MNEKEGFCKRKDCNNTPKRGKPYCGLHACIVKGCAYGRSTYFTDVVYCMEEHAFCRKCFPDKPKFHSRGFGFKHRQCTGNRLCRDHQCKLKNCTGERKKGAYCLVHVCDECDKPKQLPYFEHDEEHLWRWMQAVWDCLKPRLGKDLTLLIVGYCYPYYFDYVGVYTEKDMVSILELSGTDYTNMVLLYRLLYRHVNAKTFP